MLKKSWVNPRNRRFYRVSLFQDLLGSCVVFRVWGCIDTQQSCSHHRVMNSWEEGISLLRELDQRRLRSGYFLSEIESPEKRRTYEVPPWPRVEPLTVQPLLTGLHLPAA
ncbi:hypothetical protein Q4485_10080 [Granulosicoccaceae sp. 1_MG-2023]|nr:hypothetical protein [Granulosicoccaceae sp. 1_MG-2023]